MQLPAVGNHSLASTPPHPPPPFISTLYEILREHLSQPWRALNSQPTDHADNDVAINVQARYPQLLAALRKEMACPQYALLPAQLAAVVSPVNSPAFDSIQY